MTVIRQLLTLIGALLLHLLKLCLTNVSVVAIELHQVGAVVVLELTLGLVGAAVAHGKALDVDLAIFGA